MRVITGNGSSEFGNAGGAIVNATIKSGTNTYHGNAFGFLRNQVLDANSFFNNRNNVKKQAFNRDIFGGTFGGPIIRNKAFFFIDYEGTEQRSSGPATATVAPAGWRTGDLSDFLTRQNQVVRDPLTGVDTASRTPFPGNIIPAARLTNPVARALFGNAGLYPLPNNAGTGALGITSNYVSSSASLLKNYQGDVKIDYRPNDKVGQLGTHLVVPHEANNPIAGTGLVASWTPANDRRPLFLNGSLPNVGNIALTESSARMSYNSLQVTGRRRFADGLEFVTTYTFSKSMMENLGYYGCGSTSAEGAYWQDAYNRRGNRGPSCFDAKHNFTLGGMYNLPVGKGQKFGSNMARAADLIVGGWNVTYFASAHSGFPVTVFASSANTGGRTPRGNVRANAYRPYVIPSQTVDQFFGAVTAANFCAAGVDNGTCAFGIPAVGSLGNAGVGTLRAPSLFNFDTSIGKKSSVTEKQYIDFRMEMFNAFNHASWGPPGRDITNPGAFGQITGQVQNPRNIQFGLKYYF